MTSFKPAYLKTINAGRMAEKIKNAFEILASCSLCPRKCRVDRLSGETGVCKTAYKAYVSSYNAHFGEESPLVGQYGSGTIFFTHCNLMCNFCQNYEISHEGDGKEITVHQLAKIMIVLQESGCHNINFVTPTHVVPMILSSVEIAARMGLNVPLIYNTSGYETLETIKLIEGVFDIYMPDFKFWGWEIAEATCKARDYPEVARRAIIEMHRQVGNLVINDSGIAVRGLLIRHLVLPNNFAGTRQIMRFIVNEISPDSYVNIMPQYRPCGKAHEIKALCNNLSKKEYEEAVKAAKDEGISRFDKQPRIALAFW
ncbi:MAG: radical SAM protein [Desulfobacterales bacterium]|nr:radical SAM protein [Desulfobacterales bacterium]